jgi:type IV secretory pathway VirB10-like protein
MGQNMNNVGAMLKNPKQRNIYLMIMASVVVMIVGGLIFATSGNKNSGQGAAQVARLPNVDSVPGASDSARYNKMVDQNNVKEAEKALEEGKSYVAVPVNSGAFTTESPIDQLDKQIKEQKEKEAKEIAEAVKEEPKEILAVTPEPVPTEIVDVAPNPVQPVVTKAIVSVVPPPKKYGNDEDYLLISMLNSVSGAKASKAEFDYNGQTLSEESKQAQIGQQFNSQGLVQANNGVSKSAGVLLAKAGTIFNAVLETGIDSDEPSPVLAKIVSGDLKGTRLIGGIQLSGEKVIVTFSTASIPSMPTSIKINTVAVDPGTSRVGLASDVDRHYFLRYGVLLGAAFMGTYADIIAAQGVNTNVVDGVVVTSKDPLTAKEKNLQAIGSVGKELANETRQSVRGLKPTVTVNSGSAIGVLLMEDLYSTQ